MSGFRVAAARSAAVRCSASRACAHHKRRLQALAKRRLDLSSGRHGARLAQATWRGFCGAGVKRGALLATPGVGAADGCPERGACASWALPPVGGAQAYAALRGTTRAHSRFALLPACCVAFARRSRCAASGAGAWPRRRVRRGRGCACCSSARPCTPRRAAQPLARRARSAPRGCCHRASRARLSWPRRTRAALPGCSCPRREPWRRPLASLART